MEEKLFTADDLWKARKEGEDSKVLHNQPSELTKQFMEETREQARENVRQHEALKNAINELPTKEEMTSTVKTTIIEALYGDEKGQGGLLEKLDKRYASKLAERAIYALTALIITGFVYSLIDHLKGK